LGFGTGICAVLSAIPVMKSLKCLIFDTLRVTCRCRRRQQTEDFGIRLPRWGRGLVARVVRWSAPDVSNNGFNGPLPGWRGRISEWSAPGLGHHTTLIIFIHHQVVEKKRKNNNNLTKLTYLTY